MHINGLGPVIYIAALRRHGISFKAHGFLYEQSYTLHYLPPQTCYCGTTLHSVSAPVGGITGYCSFPFVGPLTRILDGYYSRGVGQLASAFGNRNDFPEE